MSMFDAIYAALDAARTVTQTAEAADNAEFDAWQQTLATAKATIADRDAKIAALTAQLAALQPAIRWGSSVERRKNPDGSPENFLQALARLQTTLGPIDRARYYEPEGALPAWPISSPAAEAAMKGIELDYSCKPNLADVTAGKVDAAIDAWCAKADDWFKRTGQKTRICMWHEADVKIRKGVFTLAAYRAAADHFNTRVKAFGSKGIETACNFTKFTLMPGNGLNFADLLPAATDVHAWDVYKTDPKTTVTGMFDPIRANAAKYGKPWCVFECAVDAATHTPAQLLAALTEIASNVTKGSPAPVSFDYFNSTPGGAPPAWPIDGNPAAAAAWKAGRTA